MKKIDVLVRALIIYKGKILVCKKKNKNYYLLPGGHVEFKESAFRALERELTEELGLKIKRCDFIGGSEHYFVEDKKRFHEINLVFKTIPQKFIFISREKNLQPVLLNKKQFFKERILPEILKKAILKWLKTRKTFWLNEIK